MTEVERVARAICHSYSGRTCGPSQNIATREIGWKYDGKHFDEYVERHWREWLNEAAFAIDAVRNYAPDAADR